MEYKKNKVSFIIFLIILFSFVVGGFLFVFFMNKPKDIKNSHKQERVVDYRIDKGKDYILFENEKIIIEGEEDEHISHYDIVINLENYSYLQDELNSFSENIIYDEDSNVQSFNYREYKVISFDNYVSLIIYDSLYESEEFTPKNISAYIFDKKTGAIVPDEKLLEEKNITTSTIKGKIKEKLEAYQVIEEDEPVIKIDETMNDLSPVCYLNKVGKLEVDYIVKSTKTDYYDTIIID